MKKRMATWVIGGLIAVSAVGLPFAGNIVNAAEKNTTQQSCTQDKMMKDGQMGTMDHQMMNSPEMQKQCLDMMKSMMKQPEMQAMMKQMLASDPELRKTMSDMVNAVAPDDQNANSASPSDAPAPMPGMDHNAHHSHTM